MDYCAECQSAIDAALASIPKKYTWKMREIRPTLGLLDALAETKEKVEKAMDTGHSLLPFAVVHPLSCSVYDNVDIYVRGGIEYHVGWNDPTPEEKHVSVRMEYSIADGQFTGKAWTVDSDDSYEHQRPIKLSDIELIEESPMDPPRGTLFFDTVEWDIVTPKYEQKDRKHVRHEYYRFDTGAMVKFYLSGKDPSGCRNGCPSVNPDDVYDFLIYRCTFVKYEDEDFETITDVRVR